MYTFPKINVESPSLPKPYIAQRKVMGEMTSLQLSLLIPLDPVRPSTLWVSSVKQCNARGEEICLLYHSTCPLEQASPKIWMETLITWFFSQMPGSWGAWPVWLNEIIKYLCEPQHIAYTRGFPFFFRWQKVFAKKEKEKNPRGWGF